MAEGETTLSELALLFLRLGATAFGGPAVHIAMMRDEVVARRRWMSEERFVDLLGATNLIPGPNSTEMALHIGWVRRGWAGLLVAGACFIGPAVLIACALGYVYIHALSLPAMGAVLYGVKPVMIGVVLQAIWGLARTAARTTMLRLLAVAALVLAAVGVHELVVLFAVGLTAILAARLRPSVSAFLPIAPAVAAGGAAAAVSLPSLFWVFLKTGAVLFGSGYVLLAYLRADLVVRLGWLSESQLIDAVAIGQITPGPVSSTATFIGYILAGAGGAAVATAGIFLPAFVFVALSGPLIPRLRASPVAAAFLDGVNVASLALMALVTVELGRAALVDAPTIVLAVVAGALLLRYRLNATWLVLGGALAGWAVRAVT